MKIHVTIKSPTGDELHSFIVNRDTVEDFNIAAKQFANDIYTSPYTTFTESGTGKVIMMQPELLKRCSLTFQEVPLHDKP